jgi:tRNA A58 N-methylase Trm61
MVQYVGSQGTPGAMDALREGSDLTMTAGEDLQCFATIAADNVMRGLLHKPTVDSVDDRGWALQAHRIFTQANAAEAGVPAGYSEGYGGACSAAYKQIWSGE